ncbi:MAG TPA: DUF3089 domain-containing protein [Saprospiraceae bacterium]|nr:DUF3089 domain-containing protein [Saprospiraceae bacterium]
MKRVLPSGYPLFILLLGFSSCVSLPRGTFIDSGPSTPDYSLEQNWAALPMKKDSADAVPISTWTDQQTTSPVDVFFVHPTTYTGKSGQHDWNARLDDARLNARTDRTTIRYQASLFNGAGRVYAPRYRQAHLDCFFTKQKKEDATKALNLAYADVVAAFHYYLSHYNAGRPFIIAGHSQGTLHAARLIKEEIEGTPLQKQFIVAYLPGMPVKADYFKSINPCTTPEQTGCFCSWRTFRSGYVPKKYHRDDENIVVTNPVTWKQDETTSGKQQQLGAVLRDFCHVMPALISTQVYEDLLWVNKPKFKWSFLFMTKNYHIADYNLFYADVRRNAQDRVKAFLGQ